jgi:hypothetical protein
LQHATEPLSLRARLLHDAGSVALLALTLGPFYLLLSQYWRSLVTLLVVYGALAFICLRLGRYIRRVMRRTPAEIPPWHTVIRYAPQQQRLSLPFTAAEAIQHTLKDPNYVQDVLKPRLRQLLLYRLHGVVELPPDVLSTLQHADLDPQVMTFLQTPEATGPWARYRYRQQRLQNVLATLRQLESL